MEFEEMKQVASKYFNQELLPNQNHITATWYGIPVLVYFDNILAADVAEARETCYLVLAKECLGDIYLAEGYCIHGAGAGSIYISHLDSRNRAELQMAMRTNYKMVRRD